MGKTNLFVKFSIILLLGQEKDITKEMSLYVRKKNFKWFWIKIYFFKITETKIKSLLKMVYCLIWSYIKKMNVFIKKNDLLNIFYVTYFTVSFYEPL